MGAVRAVIEADLPMEIIIRTVSAFTGISVRDIRSDRRQAPIVRARFIAVHLCREFTSASLPVIGRMLGGRDHTTIIHALRRAADRSQRDPVFAADIGALGLELQMQIEVSNG
jgi:chromosomal replication initiator protein